MSEDSKIEWTTHTFNPWIGCAKVSPGCKHCYAETLMDTRYGRVEWGVHGTRVRTSPANWRKPLRWNREAEASGIRARVFCASLADVFEERAELDPWRADLFALIEATPHLDWQLLTKRPELVMGMVPESWRERFPAHVWIGTSVENQEYARLRIPALLQIPSAVRFLSCEPLLGPLRILDRLMDGRDPGRCGNCGKGHGFDRCPNYGGISKTDDEYGCYDFRRVDFAIHWVIVGGESGPGARPCDVAWIRSLVEQCRAAEVACFVKQLGADPRRASTHATWSPEAALAPMSLRDRKGGDPDEWPADLRVRAFPQSVVPS